MLPLPPSLPPLVHFHLVIVGRFNDDVISKSAVTKCSQALSSSQEDVGRRRRPRGKAAAVRARGAARVLQRGRVAQGERGVLPAARLQQDDAQLSAQGWSGHSPAVIQFSKLFHNVVRKNYINRLREYILHQSRGRYDRK